MLIVIWLCGGAASVGAVQSPSPGTWIGPWDWKAQVHVPGCRKAEFSSAALIPVGQLAGKVLLWKSKLVADACDPEPPNPPTEAWIFRPNNPAVLVRVETDLPTNIFCSGLSWNWQGHLLVAGGASTSGSGTPSETYRFNPTVLGVPIYPIPPCDPCDPVTGGDHLWVAVGSMSLPRYYPSLVPLNRLTIDSDCDIVDPAGPTPAISGGAHLVLGGPPTTPELGNELWQLFDPVTDIWSHTLVPEDPLQPTHVPSGPVEVYTEEPSPTGVQQLLDTYPRAFQLGEPDPSDPNINGQVFVANDIDTAVSPPAPPPNDPGKTWVIKPPSATPTGCWELWHGQDEPRDPGDCPGDNPPNCFKDRYYGTAVLLHTMTDKNRIIVFGGSQDPNFPSPCNATSDWRVNDSVWEHQPVTGQDAVVNGTWRQKASLIHARVFLNAVTLPTGQILIVGGDAIDTHKNHYAGANCLTHPPDPLSLPVVQPELFDPGQFPSSLGTTRVLAPSNLVPPTGPNLGQDASSPRLYHHIALLLPDGRVFVAGGDWEVALHQNDYPESKFSGEVFYPPYLDLGTRPAITAAPGAVAFSTSSTTVTFDVEVTVFHPRIEKVVLLRPGALTHHCDMDQRYIELAWQVDPADQGYTPNPAGVPITLNVDAPDESLGPPGYYMLFVVEDTTDSDPLDLEDLIPSNGPFIRLKRR